ncbi:unnamed protein product [Brachionus calyciflorus]|uniref:Uncharacterized protein n=1 Tax=Brachionus calyciflorus TaxID=104777 RepID=A0A814P4Y9_9BILA|nr:unnamed protein product [Brachionus calyciflorus]
MSSQQTPVTTRDNSNRKTSRLTKLKDKKKTIEIDKENSLIIDEFNNYCLESRYYSEESEENLNDPLNFTN